LGDTPVDPYALAIEKTLGLIAHASATDEEAVSDLIVDMHERAARKVVNLCRCCRRAPTRWSVRMRPGCSPRGLR